MDEINKEELKKELLKVLEYREVPLWYACSICYAPTHIFKDVKSGKVLHNSKCNCKTGIYWPPTPFDLDSYLEDVTARRCLAYIINFKKREVK